MSQSDLEYKLAGPSPPLADFVESIWMLVNHSEYERDIIVLPDGRFDLFFSYSATEPYHVTLMGLGSEPSQTTISPKTVIYAVSFKLLAIEYLLNVNVASLLNGACYLPSDFWDITADDLTDFDDFCKKVSEKMAGLVKGKVDGRKRNLFDLIYSSNGALSVNQLSDKAAWSSRQINRYFNQKFGISLKAYCSILRFRASFQHIREGKLYPELKFTDQAHFIKEVKRLSGVVPKELAKNKNDRFIQFSALTKK
jgi:AraC-like DNA-binding protein